MMHRRALESEHVSHRAAALVLLDPTPLPVLSRPNTPPALRR